MLTRSRKRSARIKLVLLGAAAAAALSACGNSDDERRDLYASRQDCVKDWGDETKCESAPSGTTSSHPHTGGGYWYGPSYSRSTFTRAGSYGAIGSARSGSHAVSSSSVSRGGFGHSSSGHGGSSS